MPMPMPTRVLVLCEDHARPSIMLVESRGMKARYLALRVSPHSQCSLRIIVELWTVRSVAAITS
jgi:hypothetical protein